MLDATPHGAAQSEDPPPVITRLVSSPNTEGVKVLPRGGRPPRGRAINRRWRVNNRSATRLR